MEDRRRIPIVDKRRSSEGSRGSHPEGSAAAEAAAPEVVEPLDHVVTDASEGAPETGAAELDGIAVAEEVDAHEERNDFLDDLKRLQADFDNYRKRMMREQAATSTRAKARFMEQLLPVLDAFEQALAHEDGSSGTELIYKQLRSVLEAEGLQEIPAEGVPFDPHVHDAVESREDPEVDQIVARSVYRRGYKLGDQVLRAAMVVVARPPEDEAPEAAEG